MKFTKMHGLGNDYIYINCFEEDVKKPSELAIEMSNRNFGVGSDGLVLIMPSQKADFRMRMFNADGSEAEMCGNAIRCVGKYVYDNGLTHELNIAVETLAGIKILDMKVENGKVELVKVDMGEPIFDPALVPVKSEKNPVIGETIEVNGTVYDFTCVSVGNPHAITYVHNVDDFPVQEVGKIVEVNEKFPKKTNVEFVQVVDKNTLKMRVWERGSGETMACGTGACATLVATVLNNKSNRKSTIKLLGGDLLIEWNDNDNHIYMTGPATVSFQGIW
ncbi:diaminopimelate epimerase [Natranaerovirga hydrolytica]|uniref:Diaminopimelate epimerase n=1 Tax=Natranaerovirga hydrolytica TaxID=680378 RepID=A0A4R1MRB1_9FIRM|nr:diaminopimelate epimerase [Natranaerovirga hydrolytica]TCK92433.1 diaminopimelate epimerase [Natranaerovirga hydrolytica]